MMCHRLERDVVDRWALFCKERKLPKARTLEKLLTEFMDTIEKEEGKK